MRQIVDASAASLTPFVIESVASGSVVHTDAWAGYTGVGAAGYTHEVSNIKRSGTTASTLLPRVHRVISLLKRWITGTHQGAISRKHLDYYLDEFTFRFNRRTSGSRGLLFQRLVEQALALSPVRGDALIGGTQPQGIVSGESSA